MTDKIRQAIQAGRIVTVCWEPTCALVRIPGTAAWVPYPSGIPCRQQSHGICPRHEQEYSEKIDRFLSGNTGA